MAAVFDHNNYKLYLLKNLNEAEGRGVRSSLAQAMGCHLPYLSRVLNGDAELSLEQAEAASRFFALSPLESSYFLAMVGAQRAGTAELKKIWEDEQTRLLNEHAQLSRRTPLKQPLSEEQITVYYSEWHYSAIHVMTGIRKLQSVDAIATALSLPKKVVREALHFLCEAGLVTRSGGRFVCKTNQIHLRRESAVVNQQHANWRMRSIHALSKKDTQNLHYTTVIRISKKDLPRIKDVLIKSIESARSLTQASGDEIAAAYTIDLFQIGDQP